ncbi:MAG: hypothetical protein KF816_16500 [Melioribacteraceae bacterium]|nr:hypothetical protein [Melioribacteraceae bacterium]
MSKLGKKFIRITVHQDDKSRLEYLIERLSYIMKDLDLSEPEFEPKSENVNYSLHVSYRSKLDILVESLTINGFYIESSDEKIIEIIKNSNDKYREELKRYAASLDLKKNVNKKHDNLDKLIDEGKYKELIKVAKDVTYNPESITKAKAGIPLSVNNLIIKVIDRFSRQKMDIEEAISTLTTITSDKELPYFNSREWMYQAGIVAVELCSQRDYAIKNLIKISNQKNSDQLINVKAAIKFSEILFGNLTKYEEQIKLATKELNTRWLSNVAEAYRNKLSKEENEAFDKLVDFINDSK